MLENEFVKLIKFNNIQMIDKKIVIPLTKSEIIEQHKFVNYLYDNNINVAYIFKLYRKNEYYCEIQKYIENNRRKYNLEDLIKLLSIFHKVSKKYPFNFTKKNYYYHDFECNGHRLNKILLGYDEKFHIYPLKNYSKFINIFKFNNNEKYIEIINFYNFCYNKIRNKYKNSLCIIHNDITKNNVVNSYNGLFLIDFDLCNYSYEIVDIADAVMIHFDNLTSLLNNIDELFDNLKNIVKLYNKFNNINLTMDDIIFQIFIKLVSYNCYVVLDLNNKKMFEKNFDILYDIMKLIKEECNVKN